MSHRPVVIVGAGPAGLSAAIALAERDIQVTLIDENPRVGGQIHRQPPPRPRAPPDMVAPGDARRGGQLRGRVSELSERIELLTDARVWSLFPPRRLAITRQAGWDMVAADHLLLATGAYEYCPPFPGWTLPGVMTPGGAQSLAKTFHVRPGRRAIVAGSGPFLLIVALQLHAAGVQVVGVVETARLRDLWLEGWGLLKSPRLAAQGLDYLDRLRRAGIPLHWGHVVTEARGGDTLREVVVAACDQVGRAKPDRAWTASVDTLAIGYGFVPRIELAQLADCRLEYVDERGGWLPISNDDGESSVPDVWIAGDGGGVAGALAAQWTGTLAGLSIARRLGCLNAAGHEALRRPLLRRLGRLRGFRAALDRAYRVRPGLTDLATDDTLVCRCEELTLRQVTAGIDHGGVNPRTLKVATRIGMGPCQGRMCWPAMTRRLSRQTGCPVELIGPPGVRPPCAPITIGDLLCDDPLTSAGSIPTKVDRGSRLAVRGDAG
jgi:NADPH-dependent 2,4-dienoyl-CoA reductase/sulfur reductase-like enzyme